MQSNPDSAGPASSSETVSVIIATLGRGPVVLDTIRQLLAQTLPAIEILIVDQTEDHDAQSLAALRKADQSGHIRWIRMGPPSQPAALNRGLREARGSLVVFLDDDIRIDAGFLAAHVLAYQRTGADAVVGQVLQPGELPLPGKVESRRTGVLADLDFPFRSAEPAWVENGMSGNLLVRRALAVQVGGFDERFTPPVSYRFDTDFCKRIVAAGGHIAFAPDARIDHLRAPRGGTRSRGSHMTSASPIHGVGDYYFALKQGLTGEMLRYMARRPIREVATRFHLRHPWWIPVKLMGEMRALFGALRLWRQGPLYLRGDRAEP